MTSKEFEEGFQRVYGAVTRLFEPVDPSAAPGKAPIEFQQWALNTQVLSILTAGYAAFAEHLRQQREGPLRMPQHLPPALHDMYLRNQQGARVARIANKALWGGVYALMFGSLFYGTEAVAAIGRDQKDLYNTVSGGVLTGALFGGMLPGTAMFKVTRAAMGAAAGGSAGLLAGYLSHVVIPSLESRTDSSDTPTE